MCLVRAKFFKHSLLQKYVFSAPCLGFGSHLSLVQRVSGFLCRIFDPLLKRFPDINIKQAQKLKYLQFATCILVFFSCWRPSCLLAVDSPFFSLSSITQSRRSCSFLLKSAINTVLSAYHILLRLRLPIINPGRVSSSLRIVSLKRLNKSAEKTHLLLLTAVITKRLLGHYWVDLSNQ